jgi:hypothetical protein
MSDPEKPDVTAPVTEPETPKKPKEKTAWERVNLTKEEWDALEIPPMFRRAHSDTKPPARPPSPATSPTPSSVAAPAASSSPGKKSGKRRSSGTASTPFSTTDQPTKTGTKASWTASEPTPPTLTDFDKFKIVTPEDIETKIRHEADRRYRDWTPSAADTRKRKGKTSRPRIEWFIKQVRKEFY